MTHPIVPRQFAVLFAQVLADLHTYDPDWDSEENVRGLPPGGHAATWRLYREVEEIMRKAAAEEAAALEAGVEADAEEAEDTDSDYDEDVFAAEYNSWYERDRGKIL